MSCTVGLAPKSQPEAGIRCDGNLKLADVAVVVWPEDSTADLEAQTQFTNVVSR